jgi:beta-phosphoglucomutase-like phosphatase (HAD superfamily)
LTLGLTGLLPFVEGRIFSAHELGCFKPDPGLFLAAAAALGVEARRCAVVEDSDPGIEAGLAAGMQVYALGSQADLRRAPGVRVLPALTNLLEAPWHRERGELPIQCADGAIFRG